MKSSATARRNITHIIWGEKSRKSLSVIFMWSQNTKIIYYGRYWLWSTPQSIESRNDFKAIEFYHKIIYLVWRAVLAERRGVNILKLFWFLSKQVTTTLDEISQRRKQYKKKYRQKSKNRPVETNARHSVSDLTRLWQKRTSIKVFKKDYWVFRKINLIRDKNCFTKIVWFKNLSCAED